MIDDKKLLWDRLKDTAQVTLEKDMEEKIGQLFDKHKQEINSLLHDYVTWALTRFSTTEIRTAFTKLTVYHNGLKGTIDFDSINKLDEWLHLDDISIQGRLNYHSHVQKMSNHPIMTGMGGLGMTYHTTKNYKNHSSRLADLIRGLKKDKRKMRRLVRKEAKLRKKGVRLFDSSEQF